MPLTMYQRKRLREGRKCLSIPKRRMSVADRFDLAVIVGVICVLAVSFWLRIPLVEDAAMIVMSVLVVFFGGWAILEIIACMGGEPESSDTITKKP